MRALVTFLLVASLGSAGCHQHKPVAYAYGGALTGLGTIGLVSTAVGSEPECSNNDGICFERTPIAPIIAATAVAVGLTLIVLTKRATPE